MPNETTITTTSLTENPGPGALELRHTPGVWEGTFQVVVRALFVDLLADGQGVEASIVAWSDDENGYQQLDGVVVSLDESHLHFADGTRVSVFDIHAVRLED